MGVSSNRKISLRQTQVLQRLRREGGEAVSSLVLILGLVLAAGLGAQLLSPALSRQVDRVAVATEGEVPTAGDPETPPGSTLPVSQPTEEGDPGPELPGAQPEEADDPEEEGPPPPPPAPPEDETPPENESPVPVPVPVPEQDEDEDEQEHEEEDDSLLPLEEWDLEDFARELAEAVLAQDWERVNELLQLIDDAAVALVEAVQAGDWDRADELLELLVAGFEYMTPEQIESVLDELGINPFLLLAVTDGGYPDSFDHLVSALTYDDGFSFTSPRLDLLDWQSWPAWQQALLFNKFPGLEWGEKGPLKAHIYAQALESGYLETLLAEGVPNHPVELSTALYDYFLENPDEFGLVVAHTGLLQTDTQNVLEALGAHLSDEEVQQVVGTYISTLTPEYTFDPNDPQLSQELVDFVRELGPLQEGIEGIGSGGSIDLLPAVLEAGKALVPDEFEDAAGVLKDLVTGVQGTDFYDDLEDDEARDIDAFLLSVAVLAAADPSLVEPLNEALGAGDVDALREWIAGDHEEADPLYNRVVQVQQVILGHGDG